MTVLLGAAPSIIGPSEVGAWMAAKGAPGAAVLLDFAGQKCGFRNAAGVPRWGSVAADMAFARASAAGRWPDVGPYEMVGSGVLRYEHDPATRDPLGALIEGARTNLLIGSDGRRGLSPVGTSPPTTAITTHLGKACAAVTFPAGSVEGWNVARAVYPYQTYPFPNTYSWSYKLATNRPLVPGEKFSVLLNGSFATAGLTFTSADNLSAWASRSVAGIANNNLGANTNLYPAITYAVTLGDPLTIYITDMQMELGPGPSSFVPTEASAATRAADNLRMPSPILPAAGFTLAARARVPTAQAPGDENTLLSFVPASGISDRLTVGMYPFGTMQMTHYVNNAYAGGIGLGGGFVAGQEARFAVSWSTARGWRRSVLGGAVVSAAGPTRPASTLTHMGVGTRQGNAPWGSTIARVALWPHDDFSDTELRGLLS